MTMNSPIRATIAHLASSAEPLLTKNEADPMDALIKKFGAHTKTVLEKFDNVDRKIREFDEDIFRIHQKEAARRSGGGGDFMGTDNHDTWGGTFTRNRDDEFRRIAQDRKGRTSLEIKSTITSATTDAGGSAGALAVPQRDGVVGMSKRRLTIRNLLNVVQVTGGAVEYVKQTGFTNNAGMVAEAEGKPSSDVKYALETVPIRTIAHWMKASRQILDDAPQLRDMIDTDLRYGLALKEEQQLLFGDGVGQNLEGMVPQASAYSAPIALASPTSIDHIGLAILQSSLTNVMPDGIIINPTDWWWMRLIKNTDGTYILGNPMQDITPSLFGLPVVVTPAMPVDKFLVGAFGEQTLYDRWSARVEVGFENDDFTRNLLTILGEERIGFAAKRPEALIYGDFGRIP